MIGPRRSTPSLLDSFNYAFEGIVHVLRTQRNMRIHFLAAITVLLAALFFDVSRLELIALLLAIAFVLFAYFVVQSDCYRRGDLGLKSRVSGSLTGLPVAAD